MALCVVVAVSTERECNCFFYTKKRENKKKKQKTKRTGHRYFFCGVWLFIQKKNDNRNNTDRLRCAIVCDQVINGRFFIRFSIHALSVYTTNDDETTGLDRNNTVWFII